MSQPYDEALGLYKRGLQEKETYLRNKAFNGAIEKLLQTRSDSSEHDVLMGESLVQVGQYPLALYYELKALKKDPSNQALRSRMEEVIKMGGLPAVVPESAAFGPSALLLAVTFGLMCLALSTWIALKKNNLKKIALGISVSIFFLLLYEITLLYRSPILAVVIHSEQLFQFPEESSQTAMQTPLPAGIIVTVLNVERKGSWIKIRTREEAMGYVPERAVRLVE